MIRLWYWKLYMRRITFLNASFFGLFIGILAVILDIYTSNLGNIFSQIAVFVLIGVIISLYSEKWYNASLNIFGFCIFMLLSYYLLKYLLNIDIFVEFIIGWSVIALISPILAFIVFQCKSRNAYSFVLRILIIAVSVSSSYLLFDRIRIYDVVINLMLAYILFIRKDYYEIWKWDYSWAHVKLTANSANFI